MIQLTVLYGHPEDEAAFDRYYLETHLPLARKMPGLKGYAISKARSLNPQEQSPTYLFAEFYFEDAKALQTALQSPEGQTAANDVQNFTTGGATLVAGEVLSYQPASIG